MWDIGASIMETTCNVSVYVAVLKEQPPMFILALKVFVYINRLRWDIIADGSEIASNVLRISDTSFEAEWRKTVDPCTKTVSNARLCSSDCSYD